MDPRRTLALCLLLVVLAGVPVGAQSEAPGPGAPDAGDSLYAGLGNGGYDVLDYALDLVIDPAARVIDGVATIEATALQALSRFNLDLLGFEDLRVRVNDLPATFERTGRELVITPAMPIPEGSPFQIEVAYSGTPGSVREPSLGAQIGFIFTNTGAYVASEPDGAATWYPVNDHPSDKATYTFRITVPEGLTAVANGVLANQETVDGGSAFTWRMDQPMASYLAMMSVGEYVIEQGDPAGDVPLRNVFPAQFAEAGNDIFSRQDEMLTFFADTFGPYPFDAYGALVIPQGLGFALETQSMSLFGITEMIAGIGNRSSAAEVIAHELAHSWFGDALTPADWSDIWLNEGFATYATWLWYENLFGPETMDEIVREYYGHFSGDYLLELGYSEADARRIVAQIGAPGNPPADDLFNMAVYERGALTLHALRVAIGDEMFFETLRTYYARFLHGNVTTADFIAVAEEVSGRDLGVFFDAWLYDPKVPPIKAMGLYPL